VGIWAPKEGFYSLARLEETTKLASSMYQRKCRDRGFDAYVGCYFRLIFSSLFFVRG